MKKIIIGRSKIAYFREGDPEKPKLVMLHGFGGNSRLFKPSMEFLINDFDILVPDLPGFGYSDPQASESRTIQSYAEVIIALCKSLKFTRFNPPTRNSPIARSRDGKLFSASAGFNSDETNHQIPQPSGRGGFNLVGHSFGGMVSIYITAHFPQFVQKLILQGAPWNSKCIRFSKPLKAAILAGKFDRVVDIASGIKNKVPRDVLSQGLKLINKHFFSLDQRDGVVYHWFKTMNLKEMTAIVNILKDFDLSQEARMIRCPTLLLIGDRDEQIFIEKSQLLAKMIPGARLKIIKKGIYATHVLYLDFPEKMAKITKGFFKA